MKPPLPPPFDPRKAATYTEIFSEPRFHLALLGLFAVVLYFSKLGGSGLATWDDCYYAQKAKEILQTGNWMTMHFDGRPEFDNPPLFMWMLALSYKIFGVTEFAAKSPSALMGVLSVMLAYVFFRYLYDRWIGLYAAFVLATTTTFAKYARHAMMDVTLTFFVLLALFGLVLAVDRKRGYFVLWGGCVAVCILIKSVLGLFPAVIGVLYLILTGKARLMATWQFLLSLLIIAVLGGFWHVHQWSVHGQPFVDVHFKWLLYRRAFVENPQPWYRYLSYFKDLVTYYWPWLPLSAFGLLLLARQASRRNRGAILSVLWIVLYLGVMSVMNARKVWYVMPAFAALALAAGLALDRFVPVARRITAAKTVFVVAILSFLVMNLTPLRADMERQVGIRLVAPYVRHFAGRGAEVVAFGYDYRSLNNPLLFYADRAANPAYMKADEVVEAFRAPGVVLCVTNAHWIDHLRSRLEPMYVVKRGEFTILISNRRLETGEVY